MKPSLGVNLQWISFNEGNISWEGKQEQEHDWDPYITASRLLEQGDISLIIGTLVLYASQQLVVVLIRLIPFAWSPIASPFHTFLKVSMSLSFLTFSYFFSKNQIYIRSRNRRLISFDEGNPIPISLDFIWFSLSK